MIKLFLRFWKAEDISRGVRLITLATAIRWMGWGFAESLIPIFIFSFSHTYAQAGFLRSAYDIAFIITLPIVGMAADRMRATTLILAGLCIYFFIGTSYLLAGVTGLVIFIFLARFANGVSFAFDSIGRETYFRRHTKPHALATVFGYFDTVANFWWIAAALAGMFLIKYVSIPVLLFMIVPTSIAAFLIIWQFRKGELEHPVPTRYAKGNYSELLSEIKNWNWTLRSLAMFNFFIAGAAAVVTFFLPIEIYVEGARLQMVILMGVVSALPMIFGFLFGRLFDQKGTRIFMWSLFVFAFLLLSLAFVQQYYWALIVSFCVGVIVEILSVGSNELITVYTNPEHFGRVGGLMRSIADLGAMLGPLAVGVIIDMGGMHGAFIVLALLMFLLGILFRVLHHNGFLHRHAVVK